MAAKQLQFIIPTRVKLADLKARLRGYMRFEEEPSRTLQRTFYDSFDWRLYARGQVLEGESENDGTHLCWRTLDAAGSAETITLAASPRFAWDLPSGAFRERLESVLEMRALMPQATVRSRVHTLRLLNGDEKTVLRVVMEDNSVLDPRSKKGRRLGKSVRVLPIKGYPKPAEQVLQLLEWEVGLTPQADDLMQRSVAALGRQPGDYSSKLEIELDPQMRADAATRQILLTLLQALEVNENGTRADIDSEFLHDFRVAVRRTRSALTQIKGVLPESVLQRFGPEFGWLGQITGPTRDLDVYLLNFETYRGSLPETVRGDLDPLLQFLDRHQDKEQKALAGDLASARYRKLVREWRAYLESPLPKQPDAPHALRPVIEVAGERIWRMFRRAIKEGQAIVADSPAEELHELRKTCKKLRYLLEFFQDLFAATKINKLIKALKGLQENLGDFQDLHVQAETLKGFSQQMMEEAKVPAATLMAMGILVEDLLKRQQQAREAFAARFAQFATAENQRLFKEVCSARSGEESVQS